MAFAPLTIDALVADRFVPIVANDVTRALSESGLLSLAFALEPTRRELFGRQLTWLRLTPQTAADQSPWRPKVRGAYLNAVWASATETLTRELLGSSTGEPRLTVRLARPPVLRQTLQLRVREPLGSEEVKKLQKEDKRAVLNTVDDLPGNWVLWKQVVDPSDEPHDARVYALNESTGEIRFGDGRHGAIPPIGVDSIVAFSYQRTESGAGADESVPANTIAARAPLNLVSPVEGVEAVVAADHSAGGAPAESDERVLRFGFARVRHRNRVVTLQDIEEVALQSSPDIVQARCLTRGGHLRLVVVMRGKDPRPTAGQVRELRRLLLSAAPPSLGAPNALRIQGPQVRRLLVELGLRVDTLDHAGELGKAAKQSLAALFDSATGGTDGEGWPLGSNATIDDIALALHGLPHLLSIDRVTLREHTDEGVEREWPAVLKAIELAMPAEDPVRITFATAEVQA
jgi:hypothetical protein